MIGSRLWQPAPVAWQSSGGAAVKCLALILAISVSAFAQIDLGTQVGGKLPAANVTSQPVTRSRCDHTSRDGTHGTASDNCITKMVPVSNECATGQFFGVTYSPFRSLQFADSKGLIHNGACWTPFNGLFGGGTATEGAIALPVPRVTYFSAASQPQLAQQDIVQANSTGTDNVHHFVTFNEVILGGSADYQNIGVEGAEYRVVGQDGATISATQTAAVVGAVFANDFSNFTNTNTGPAGVVGQCNIQPTATMAVCNAVQAQEEYGLGGNATTLNYFRVHQAGSNSIPGLTINGLLIDPLSGHVGGVASPAVYGINEVTNNRNQLGPLGQVAANLWAGTTSCSSNTFTITFPTTGNNAMSFTNVPTIIISDSTTMGGARVSARSTTEFTVTCYGATDSVDWMVVGNPN